MSNGRRKPRGGEVNERRPSLAEGLFLSASDLLRAELPGLPSTEHGIRKRAATEGWPYREVRGRGGARGVRKEYAPPAYLLVDPQCRVRIWKALRTSVSARGLWSDPGRVESLAAELQLSSGAFENAGPALVAAEQVGASDFSRLLRLTRVKGRPRIDVGLLYDAWLAAELARRAHEGDGLARQIVEIARSLSDERRREQAQEARRLDRYLREEIFDEMPSLGDAVAVYEDVCDVAGDETGADVSKSFSVVMEAAVAHIRRTLGTSPLARLRSLTKVVGGLAAEGSPGVEASKPGVEGAPRAPTKAPRK